jgi:hypothetical protein
VVDCSFWFVYYSQNSIFAGICHALSSTGAPLSDACNCISRSGCEKKQVHQS